MQINIEAHDECIAAQADQLLKFCLTGLDHDIGHVRILVQPQHDPLGTLLHHCNLKVGLHRGPPLNIDEVQADPALAISRALERAGRSVRRRGRLRPLTRSTG